MKKIVYNLLLISSISSLMYGMEMEDLSKKKIEENKEIINNNDQSSSSATTHRNNLTSQTNKIPNLNLTTLPQHKSIKNLPKITVRSHTELAQEVTKSTKTHRAMFSDSSGQNKSTHDTVIDINTPHTMSGSVYRAKEIDRQNFNDSDSPPLQNTTNDDIGNINIAQTQKKSILPLGLNNQSLLTNLTEGKFYSEEEVWEFLKKTNSALHTFSVYNNLSLDEVILYANLLDELHVHPEAVVAHIKDNVKLNSKKFNEWQIKAAEDKKIQKYQKIQKKDPEKYQGIVLDVLKAVINQQDGNSIPSPLSDTHIAMLEKQTANDTGTIRYQYIALAATLITWAGSLAWGIYGQITGNPTSAPTHMPTSSPTSMPTGAPI